MKRVKSVLLLTNLACDDPTAVAVLGGLGRAYRSQGLRVIAAGHSDLLDRRAPRLERRPWGYLYRMGGACLDKRRCSRRIFSELSQLLKRVEFAHVHFASSWNPIGAINRAFSLAGVPVGVTFQDHVNPLFRYSLGEKELLRTFLVRSRWLTALSRCAALKIADDMPELRGRLRVVPNGFDPREASLARAAAGPRGRPFVLYLGRHAFYKGTDVLLMAWKDVCREGEGADLVVCGPDEENGYYRRLAELLGISDRTIFLGGLGRKAVWGLLKGCLFLVSPSRNEAFGLAVLEAMACGKAVLATRSGGPEELIEDGVSGVLVPAADVEALRDGVLRLLKKPSLRRRLGLVARERAGGCRWDMIARSYRALGFSGSL